MSNPWISVREDDYVGHMSDPAVGQRPVLNRLLRDELRLSKPASLLFLGCSTGNGLEHVDPAVTSRVDGIDINPGFIRSLLERFGAAPYTLAARCEDVTRCAFEPAVYDLIHAPLVFEYVPWQDLLPRLARSLAPAGALSVVLQRPSVSSPPVTPTRYTRLLALEGVFHFVDPDALTAAARASGLRPGRRQIEPLPSGKAFEVFRFLRAAA